MLRASPFSIHAGLAFLGQVYTNNNALILAVRFGMRSVMVGAAAFSYLLRAYIRGIAQSVWMRLKVLSSPLVVNKFAAIFHRFAEKSIE